MAEVKINRKLNLVLSVESDKGKIYVHSTPVSRQVFEDNFLPMARAFTSVYTNGLGPVAGPRVAAMLLKREAEALDEWPHVQQSLLSEIYRLTNVLVPSDKGYDMVPLAVAKQRAMLDDDVASEVENVIVYFICASAIHMRTELAVALEGLTTLWNGQTTSFNATEFVHSLRTSTVVETTGEKPTPLPENPSSKAA